MNTLTHSTNKYLLSPLYQMPGSEDTKMKKSSGIHTADDNPRKHEMQRTTNST